MNNLEFIFLIFGLLVTGICITSLCIQILQYIFHKCCIQKNKINVLQIRTVENPIHISHDEYNSSVKISIKEDPIN